MNKTESSSEAERGFVKSLSKKKKNTIQMNGDETEYQMINLMCKGHQVTIVGFFTHPWACPMFRTWSPGSRSWGVPGLLRSLRGVTDTGHVS